MVSVSVDLIGFAGSMGEMIQVARGLEQVGVDSLNLSDDLFSADPFVALAAVALGTSKISLSFITNTYSRHPVLTARGIATLMSIAPNRINIGLGAGGSLTLKPLGIPMWERPLTRMREALQIYRTLLSGETLNFDGQIFSVHDVRLQFPFEHKPPEIFIAGRGVQILSLAGELGDGALIEPISPAYERMIIKSIQDAARRSNRDPSKIVLKTSMALTRWTPEEFQKRAAWRVANVIRDTPQSVLVTFKEDVSPDKMTTLMKIHDAPSVNDALPFVTDEVVRLYPNMVNSPERLVEILRERIKLGYRALNFEALPGEEAALVGRLTRELIQELHAIN